MSDEEDDDDSFNDDVCGDWDDEEDEGGVTLTTPKGGLTLDPIGTALPTPNNIELKTEESEAPKDYSVMDDADIEEEIGALEADAAASLNLPAPLASFLLRNYSWSKEKLLRAYKADPAAVMKKQGLHLAVKLPQAKDFPSPPKPPEEEIECPMCLDDFPAKDCISLGCGHWFCTECFQDYLVNEVKTKGEKCCLARCPAAKCPVAVTDDVVKKHLEQPYLGRYREFRRRHYVETRADRMKWCPAPGCGFLVNTKRALPKDSTHVTCNCGFKWCFNCYTECHEPVTCDQLQKWMVLVEKESETAQWIVSNTRQCPECFTRIEKNHGCNHLICSKCAYEFCWVCMGDWKNHGPRTGGYYKCNKYKERKEAKAGPKTASKQELNRFLHYFHRYHNHEDAKKYAAKMSAEIQTRMTKLHRQNTSSSWIGVQFLKEAADQVQSSRRLLKYTYVYGFWLKDGPEKELFEFLQQNLEKNTEHLHFLMSQEDVALDDRTQITNYTRITRQLGEKLLEGLQSKAGLGVDKAAVEAASARAPAPPSGGKKKRKKRGQSGRRGDTPASPLLAKSSDIPAPSGRPARGQFGFAGPTGSRGTRA